MANTNPVERPSEPEETPRQKRAATSMLLLVVGLMLILAGIGLTMLMMPYGLVLSVIGIGMVIASRRSVKEEPDQNATP